MKNAHWLEVYGVLKKLSKEEKNRIVFRNTSRKVFAVYDKKTKKITIGKRYINPSKDYLKNALTFITGSKFFSIVDKV